jgi:hypothetical protein
MLQRILILLFFASKLLFAGNENQYAGARSSGLANASVTLNDVWSSWHNQAGLGFVKNITGGIFHENRFLTKELSLSAAAIALPVKGGTFGLNFSSFGYKAYRETKYGLAFGKSFGDKIAGGIQIDYLTTQIADGYGKKGVLTGEAGFQFKLLKKLTIGAHIFNLSRTKIADYNNERISTTIRLGFSYTFSDKVFVLVETEKDIDERPILKAATEYKVAKILFLRAGVSTNPTLSSFGFGLFLKNVKLDFSANYHSVLGFTPQFGLTYDFNKQE